jgi:hypothetical protein
MKNTFICFYGDGELWKNINEVVSYPCGTTFYRDFRYRDKRIQKNILEEIKIEEKRFQFQGRKAILAMRFFSEKFQWLLLPIREIEIKHIQYMPDNHSIFFTFGRMVDFSQPRSLLDYCVQIPTSERSTISTDNILLESSVDISNIQFSKIEDEDASWVHYTNKISKDNSVPLPNEARSSVFFRLSCFPNEKCIPLGNLYNSKHRGIISGLIFDEGKNYEIGVIHRVPSLIDENKTIGQLDVEYKFNQDKIELNCSEEPYSGNYQTHILIVTSKKTTGTFEEIIIKPKTSVIDLGKRLLINTNELKVPYKVKYHFWHRLRKEYIWFFLLFLAFLLLSDPFEQSTFVSSTIGKILISGIASFIIFIFEKSG